MVISIFRPTAGSTAKQDFKYTVSTPVKIWHNHNEKFFKLKQYRWERNNWKMEFGHLLVFVALIFLVVCAPVERTPETTLNCFFSNFCGYPAKRMKIQFVGTYTALSPIIMLQWKMPGYLKDNYYIRNRDPFFTEPWIMGRRAFLQFHTITARIPSFKICLFSPPIHYTPED